MCKSKLGRARWVSLKVISAPLLVVFGTHTHAKQNTWMTVPVMLTQLDPAISSYYELPGKHQTASAQASHAISDGTEYLAWPSAVAGDGCGSPMDPKSLLPALCGWLSYFRASEMFWADCILAMGPCSLCCKLWKTCFFTFTKIPKCEKIRMRQNLTRVWFTFAAVTKLLCTVFQHNTLCCTRSRVAITPG